MSSLIGITSLGSLISAPTGCVYNEVTQEQTREIKTIKNSMGVTVQAGVLPMITTKVTAKVKGIAPLALAAAVTSISSGTLIVTGVTVEETNTDYPESNLEAIAYA